MNTLAEKYIDIRFPNSDPHYQAEWRQRFEEGREWACSDLKGQRLLIELAPGIYPPENE